jgi:exosortase A-associated hydrolase 2
MTQLAGSASAEPFFLPAEAGQRFCLFHPPAGAACRGAVIYVHPFAEEMNKARRMAALQARALAALGVGVLQIDLQGCGDSSGEFGEARWDTWKSDLALAHRWLRERLGAPVSLWGLRLGAMLALDYAAGAADPVQSLVLWQPVQSGKTYLTQFLRLRVASDMLTEGKEAGNGTHALRAQLQAGQTLEIAGYELAPALAGAIDALDLTAMKPPACPVHWFEAVAAAGRDLPPAAARVTAAWQQAGCDLWVDVVPCPPFWTAQEITECPALLEATSALFSGARQ